MNVTWSDTATTAWPSTLVGAAAVSSTMRAWLSTDRVGAAPGRAMAAASGVAVERPHVVAGSLPSAERPSSASSD